VRYEDFEQLAEREWRDIPRHFRAGIDSLIIERDARAHPAMPDIYTLGECITESYPSDFGSADTTRSLVVLYYGSFDRLSRMDPEFDWQSEIWETLTHELQHHLESLADDEQLVDMDYAVDEGFKRREGGVFDTAYYRAGESLGGGWFRVDYELFVESTVEAEDATAEFTLQDSSYRVRMPSEAYDVAFLDVSDGLPHDVPPVTVVVRPRRKLRHWLRDAWTRASERVVQVEVPAERVEE